jgi:SRSO17 transposase
MPARAVGRWWTASSTCPTSWIEDATRCAAAGIPTEVAFATKPQPGLAMLARAKAAGVLSGWVPADEVYGQNPTFRSWLAEHKVPHHDQPGCVHIGQSRCRRALVPAPDGVPARRRVAGWELLTVVLDDDVGVAIRH